MEISIHSIENIKKMDILGTKWDYLIMLDACRYDAFKVAIKGFDINGKLERRNSDATCTRGFILKYFKNKDTSNFEVIAQNPFFYPTAYKDFKPFNKVHEPRNVKTREDFNPYPAKITRKAKKLMEEYPNKRLLIHYLKPHFPFTEPEDYKDKLLKQYISINDNLDIITEDMKFIGGGLERKYLDFNTRRDLLEKYFNNLLIGLENIEELLEFIDDEKQVIITSDHGECLGSNEVDNRLGHFHGSDYNELKIVPWMKVQ